MNPKFQHTVQQRGEVSYVKLAGVLDEDNELGELVDKIPNGTAVIDLGDIERINSCGVRDWVNWLSKLESNGTQSVLVECSPAIVAQINLVNNFTGSGVVKSFYVPYFCAECDEEKVLLVEASDMGPPPHDPPTCRCDECDLVMDFDDMPDSYFAFLSTQRKATDPGEGVVAGLDRESASGLSSKNGKAKPKSRSHPSIRQPSSKPSFPSLPSIHSSVQRISSTESMKKSPNAPPRSSTPSSPRLSGMSMRMSAGPIVAAPDKSNALVFTLVAVLVAAIVILAYLALSK